MTALIDGLSRQLGYCGQTTAKVVIATLNDGPVTVTCDAGTVQQPTMVGRGGDNPARPGEFVCYVGVATITGLSPGQVYNGTITHIGELAGETFTKTFSPRTLVNSDSVPWAFGTDTCENHSQRWLLGDPWLAKKQKIEEIEKEIGGRFLFNAHIDDLGYFDTFKLFGTPTGTDWATGLATTATGGQTGAQDTGLAWDYALAWLGWMGGLPSLGHANTEGREWFRANIPLWAVWGDHEIEGDHCAVVRDPAQPAVSHGCDRTLEATAEAEYNAFCADACTPPRQAADGGPATQANAQYWGAVVGPVRFFAIDRNKYALPFNACDAGDVHTYGRSGTPSFGTCSGATTPTRTELGIGSDTQPPDFLGATQLTDMLNWLNNDEPFKNIFMSNGVALHNQPWGDRWAVEFDDFLTRATTGLLVNNKTNGMIGHTCLDKGDTHAATVVSYHADGTATGLGGAGQDNKELWELCPGTVNGSTAAGTVFTGTIPYKGKLRYRLSGKNQGDRDFAATTLTIVRGDLSSKRFEKRLYELPSNKLLWSGYMESDQVGNHFQYTQKKSLARFWGMHDVQYSHGFGAFPDEMKAGTFRTFGDPLARWGSTLPRDYTRTDKLIDKCSKLGMDIIFVVLGIEQEGNNPDETEWTNFLTELVTRYKGRIKYYESMNEPNAQDPGVGGWGTEPVFAAHHKLTVDIIRGLDPAAKFLCPSYVGITAMTVDLPDFLTELALIVNDVDDYIDVYTYHFYLAEETDFRTHVPTVKALVPTGKELWNTESGWGVPETGTLDFIDMTPTERQQRIIWCSKLQQELGITRWCHYMITDGRMGMGPTLPDKATVRFWNNMVLADS